eukprot:6483898-Amphidinium_carterae.2
MNQQACMPEFVFCNPHTVFAGAASAPMASAMSDLPCWSSSSVVRPGVFVTSTFGELPFSLPRCIHEQQLFDFGLIVPQRKREQPRPQGELAPAPQATLTFALSILTINIRSLNEAGKLKFVASKLEQLGVDIAFIQETRLPDSFDMTKIDGYHIVSSPSASTSGAHGGLMTLVKCSLDATPLFSQQVSHRVLVSAVRLSGKCCRLVNAHAPVTEAPLAEHDQFAADVGLALKQQEPGELLVVGVDLNARLMDLDNHFSCVGDCAASRCQDGAQHRRSCLSHFDAARLVAVNTVLPHPHPMTWRHNSGAEHQIDFIFVPAHLVAQSRVVKVAAGDWAVFDCATTSDHCYVVAHIVLTVDQHKRRKPPPKKPRFVNAAHIVDYVKAARDELPEWVDGQDPRSYMQTALVTLERVIKSTAPQRCVQRKPWILPATWEMLQQLNRWRRFLTAWRRGDWEHLASLFVELGKPFNELLPSALDFSEHPVLPTEYEQKVLQHIRELIKASRKPLRADKKLWFSEAVAAVAEGRGSDHARELHATVKRLCRSSNPRGRQIADSSGTVLSDPTAVQQAWFDHWTKHFQAKLVPAHDFGDRLTMATGSQACFSNSDPMVLSPLVFEEVDVVSTLRRMPANKATADAIPAAALTAVADVLGPPLCSLYNQCLKTGDVPIAYSGARIVPVWKRKGLARSCKGYRPVSLLTLEAKLLAKLCLRKLESRLDYHRSQFGTGHKCGVEFPQIAVSQIAALALDSGAASATIFVDVVAAFDSVAQPLVWGLGPQWDGGTSTLEQRGHSPSMALSLAAYLHSYPAILARVGIPYAVVDLLRVWGSASWAVTDSSQKAALRSCCGVPQGHNLAALIFDIFYSNLMSDIDRLLQQTGIVVCLPVVSSRLLSQDPSAEHCAVGGMAYRDDYALAMMDDDNKVLLNKVVQAADIITSVHNDHHLALNWLPGKTELTLKLTGASSKPLWAGLRRIGASAGHKQPALALQPAHQQAQLLLISDIYPHLGRLHGQHLRVKKEIDRRIVQSAAAFREKKAVLQSSHLPVTVRLQLLRTYVVCHLLQNQATSPALSTSEYQRLRGAYIRYVRAVVGEKSTSHRRSTLSDEQLCAHFQVPRFLNLLDRTRLGFLKRLAVVDSLPLRALLAAMFESRSFWTGMFSSLQRLFRAKLPALSALPPPSVATIGDWIQFVILHHSSWKEIVKAIDTPDPPPRSGREAQPDPLDEQAPELCSGNVIGCPDNTRAGGIRQPQDVSGGDDVPASSSSQIPAGFPCSECNFIGKNRAGLAMHARRKHGQHSHLALRIRGPQCPACSQMQDNRHRVLDHLRDSARCRRYVETLDPIPAEEMEQVYAVNRGVSLAFSRELIPKAGPKPAGELPPLNAVVPEYLDSHQRQAAIPHLD